MKNHYKTKSKKNFRDIRGSRQSLRSTKSSTTLLHDAEVDPTELEEVAVELDAAPEDEDEPGETSSLSTLFFYLYLGQFLTPLPLSARFLLLRPLY